MTPGLAARRAGGAPRPVVQTQAMDAPDVEPFRGALVAAVDDSPSAREALRFAADIAAGRGCALHVLAVWNFVSGQGPAQAPDEPPSMAAWQAEAEQRLDALVSAELAGRSGIELRRTVLHGNTVPTLLAVSEVAEQIVVGSRGRGGFRGMLLGSTSTQLVYYAGCPVTVVRHGATD